MPGFFPVRTVFLRRSFSVVVSSGRLNDVGDFGRVFFRLSFLPPPLVCFAAADFLSGVLGAPVDSFFFFFFSLHCTYLCDRAERHLGGS